MPRGKGQASYGQSEKWVYIQGRFTFIFNSSPCHFTSGKKRVSDGVKRAIERPGGVGKGWVDGRRFWRPRVG